MSTLTRRVQLLLAPHQYKRLEALARARGTSIGALIREAIEKLYLQSDEKERLEAVRSLANLRLPVGEWEQMERESMRGCDVD
ncbi:MAG: ribbon-helix-helix protein, CopG family [Deltaproteobacteria bacterium]|nr:ribbon-helix-helix protein, CopG family [Deltaproteobacteria bacterium]